MSAAPNSRKLLFADDDPLMREFIGVLCEGTRWNPTCAEDGLEALDLYEVGKFDVVLTDLNMPRMDGGHLVEAVKQINPQQPVGVLTGAVYSVGRTGLEAADLILAKPISRKALLLALDSLISSN